jgi:hypothetical protein
MSDPENESERKQAAEDLLRRFKIPFDDDDARLWRYMSIDKFVSLVVSGTAYFRRLDLLQDQYEGALSTIGHAAHVAAIAHAVRDDGLAPGGGDPYSQAYLAAGSIDELIRASIYTNCWTRNPHESWAMWNFFGQNGVAIGSTIGRVRDAFQRGAPLDKSGPVFIGEVQYIDHEADDMDWTLPFLYKNYMFDWEREVRVGAFHFPREYSIKGFNQDHKTGLFLPIDPETLIAQVVVAPRSSEEFRAQVQIVMEEQGLAGKPANFSAADRTPEYRRIHQINQQALRDSDFEVPIHLTERESI